MTSTIANLYVGLDQDAADKCNDLIKSGRCRTASQSDQFQTERTTCMQDLDESAVIELIRTAFSNTPYPGDGNCALPDTLDEEREAVSELEAIADRRFTASEYSFLGKATDWLTPQAFVYFIPGYMLNDLRERFESDDTIGVELSLLPGNARFERNMPYLSDNQKRAIAAFWQCGLRNYSDNVFDLEGVHYWDPYLPDPG
jgi:hypothetical protein